MARLTSCKEGRQGGKSDAESGNDRNNILENLDNCRRKEEKGMRSVSIRTEVDRQRRRTDRA